MAGSWREASIRLIRENGGRSFGVMFFQVFPPSRVSWAIPSSDPVQIVLRSWNDGATVKIVP